ncbi:MAG: hypothetical protein IJ704_02380 [Bacilli bacterium]|nr:hypothetical protein [Bacilli bacterium]
MEEQIREFLKNDNYCNDLFIQLPAMYQSINSFSIELL